LNLLIQLFTKHDSVVHKQNYFFKLAELAKFLHNLISSTNHLFFNYRATRDYINQTNQLDLKNFTLQYWLQKKKILFVALRLMENFLWFNKDHDHFKLILVLFLKHLDYYKMNFSLLLKHRMRYSKH